MVWSYKRRFSRPDLSTKQPAPNRSGLSGPPPSSPTSAARAPFSPVDPYNSLSYDKDLPVPDDIAKPIVAGSRNKAADEARIPNSLYNESAAAMASSNRRASTSSFEATPVQSSTSRRSSARISPSQDVGFYAINELASFSFGAAKSSHPTPKPVDPLCRLDPEDEAPERNRFVDITPRPSVVAPYIGRPPVNQHGNIPEPEITFNPYPSKKTPFDASSHHTFGTSSASESVSSLSSHGNTSSTRQTSAASTDDETSRSDREDRQALYFSDEEYDDEEYSDDEAYHVEIGSATQVDPQTSAWGAFGGATFGRRGSLPMAIPGAESRSPTNSALHRDSIIYARRPSRSLDDDKLHIHHTVVGAMGSAGDASSVPGSQADIDLLVTKQRAIAGRESVSTQGTVRPATRSLHDYAAPPVNLVIDEFSDEWRDMVGGITSLSGGDLVDLTASGPRRPSVAGSVVTFDDTFNKAVGRWDEDGYGQLRMDWTFKREQADGGGPTRSPKSGFRSPNSSSPFPFLTKAYRDRSPAVDGTLSPEEKEKQERLREKERRSPANWKGMPVSSGEVWGNKLVGRYQVNRTVTTHSTKGNQQRLGIVHFRDSATRLLYKSPPTTVHKHSKATAFSIGRFYRQRPGPGISDSTTPGTQSQLRDRAPDGGPTRIKGTNMVLLAPWRVQQDYTTTNTTRKLESHGLLDEGKDESHGSDVKKKERKRTKSISNTSLSSSDGTRSLPPPMSEYSGEHTRRRRRPPISDDEDDLFMPRRTPHTETYSTVDPETLRNISTRTGGSSLLSRAFNSARGAPVAPYAPQWMVLTPRQTVEERNQVVKNLNASFATVGLLPEPKEKDKSRKNRPVRDGSSSLFEQLPRDTLFMLLPLWPGETDPSSSKRHPFNPKPTPLEDRLYLIVFYKINEIGPAVPRKNAAKQKKDSRKARPSPTASFETREEWSIIFSTFHISACIVTYPELRGSNIRVPDEGLAVSGPLREAYASMPTRHQLEGEQMGTQVIADCRSREGGIEFDREGLRCLGLCTLDSEGLEIPTPLGRAVMEMAWIGGMALTSFGGITS